MTAREFLMWSGYEGDLKLVCIYWANTWEGVIFCAVPRRRRGDGGRHPLRNITRRTR